MQFHKLYQSFFLFFLITFFTGQRQRQFRSTQQITAKPNNLPENPIHLLKYLRQIDTISWIICKKPFRTFFGKFKFLNSLSIVYNSSMVNNGFELLKNVDSVEDHPSLNLRLELQNRKIINQITKCTSREELQLKLISHFTRRENNGTINSFTLHNTSNKMVGRKSRISSCKQR